MKTIIVCGLLGAGKTTFIRNFVRSSGKRTVVLVNDFGKAGIDGEVYSAGGIESIELPSGCVCCTLRVDLIDTIKKITSGLSPEQLLIEPSGVASPSAVLEALEVLNVSDVTVVGIVDATEFLDLLNSEMYGSFFEDQIRNADIILVNKTDLAGDEKSQNTMIRIGEMNPMAVVTSGVKGVPAEFFPETFPERQPLKKQNFHFSFDSLSLIFSNNVSMEKISSLLHSLANGAFGKVVRAKALLQTSEGPYRFDISFGKVNTEEFERGIDSGRLVVIGEDLLKEELARAVERLNSHYS
jgi:G3E family GTPase